ncbi:conserved hypothetical protein [Talaromyces stipitatus ATCC 10500]|uniref:BED-type domain-containing protein n=1 Tax=Talaromyces stipitatus (strain ATCC 10500 / CBS 375.48 / QM 6759 / NRRL 1006) TaxID=441959 RepID=B8MA73_TALSN|nr:uncharacterized protein TSTA_121450 [Talaromyces stipitatus ATCC 10500]EED18402.1 conserved hypothetical protein [Talaromyces stipitatus ATCC 10500]
MNLYCAVGSCMEGYRAQIFVVISDLPHPSLLSVPLTQDSTSRPRSIRKLSAHETWSHTRTPREGEPERQGKNRLFYCKYCESYSAQASNNFRDHLKKKHGIDIQPTPEVQSATLDQLQQLYLRAISSGQTQEIDTQVLQKVLDKDMINEALVSLIVARNLPFNVVEWPEFHVFCRLLNPEADNFITTAHSEIAKKIEQSYESQKDTIRKILQSAESSIHLSLDIWTSPNKLLFLGICAHFVGRDQGKLSKALIGLRTVANHSGVEQFATLLLLQDYGIVQNIGSIIADNASSNDTLCRAIGEYLNKEEGLQWNALFKRIRCIGHVINLAVQAFLFHNYIEIDQLGLYEIQEEAGELASDISIQQIFRVMGLLGKCHNIVIHIRGSAARTAYFKTLAGRMIPLDNRTRWNSWSYMCEVALDYSSAIDTYTKEYLDDLQDDYLTLSDWSRLRTINQFLKPFRQATLVTQGHQATIDRYTLYVMDAQGPETTSFLSVAVSTKKTKCEEEEERGKLALSLEALQIHSVMGWRPYGESGLKRQNCKILSTNLFVQYREDKEICSRVQKCWDTFDIYYSKTDDSPLYAAALILHPNRRTRYIHANWRTTWQKPAINKVKKLWRTYRERAPPLAILGPYSKASEDPDKELSEFNQIQVRMSLMIIAVESHMILEMNLLFGGGLKRNKESVGQGSHS